MSRRSKKQSRPAAPLFAPLTLYDQENDTDYEARLRARARRRRGDRIYLVLMAVFALIFVVSAGMLIKRYFDDRRVEDEFAGLAALIDTSVTAAPAEGEPARDNSAKFAALRAQNPDFFGWISIPETNLDFPVMYTPDRPDHYLKHDFNGQYSDYGVPYLDEDCTMTAERQSENLVVYGHNMKTGTIFGCLTGYREASYYQSHPVIRFDTLYGDAEYEVFAAFAIDVAQDTSFVYNRYLDMDEATYDQYVSEVIRRSDVQTGIRPVYGEQLLTLSTCEYSTANGRYVVVARRLPQTGSA